MQADKVLKAIIAKRGLRLTDASRKAGRSDSYFFAMFGNKSVPKIDTMADLCDCFDWDLVARDRTDGYEIEIDPPM